MDAREAARRWSDTWKRGWESLDPEPILALYAAEASLVTEPFREPARGRDAIREYVERVLGEEEDPRVWTAEPIVDGSHAAVAWWASLREGGADSTLAGISLVHFGPDGLVVDQWDAWNQVAERREPGVPGPFGRHGPAPHDT